MTKVVVVCDCGCGETLEKQPNKMKQHQHHFVNPQHYYRWLKHNMRQPDHTVLNRLKVYGELWKRIHGGEFE